MQPGKTSVTLLFNAPNQYVIPVFQRGYVWTLEKQIAPLWSDLVDRANALRERQAIEHAPAADQLGTMRKHFLGSLVLTPVINAFGRVGAYEVIDGQQRTTTLHLLLLAFRDVAKKLENRVLLQMLENLTRNPGPYNVANDHHKVWPTKAGREEMALLNSVGGPVGVYSRYPVKVAKARMERPLLIQSYLYLFHAILAFLRGVDLDDPVSDESETTYSDQLIHRIRHDEVVGEVGPELSVIPSRGEVLFMALQDHVQIMTLTLEGEDDPQVIFETLNARGEPLLASDLIRNFVFLEATRKNLVVGDLYNSFWQDFDEQLDAAQKVTTNRYWREKERQGRITHPRIDLFFYHYTILRRVAETKVGHVFQNFKDWWQRKERNLAGELEHIRTASGTFKALISPSGEGRLSEFARLVKALDVSTFIPVYLRLRELYGETNPDLVQAIGDLESYVVRRAVCGLTTKNFNRIALKLLETLEEATDPALALRVQLQALGGPSQCWPSDQDFRDSWVSRPVYQLMRVGKVCAILRALELSSRNNKQEAVPIPTALTVEHVLPQEWEKTGYYPIPEMTDDQRLERNRLLHSFGNLTLLTQPLNSSASNGPFEDVMNGDQVVVGGKRPKICANSLLKMNAYFQSLGGSDWNEAAIKTRGENLLKQAVQMWQRPIPEIVLQLGTPNGMVTLSGLRAGDEWTFSLLETTLGPTPAGEDQVKGISKQADTWDQALALLDKNAWCSLAPRFVHPEFTKRAWDAFAQRVTVESEADCPSSEPWRKACKVAPRPALKSVES